MRIFLGVLSDDKLLIEQQLPSGESIVRLAPNGTPDGFVVPIDDYVRTIAPYPGNRIMIAGLFGQVENKPRTRVARLFGTSVGGSGVGGSGGSASVGGDSGAAGTGAGADDAGAAGDGGAAGDSSAAGNSGAAGSPKGGASGQGGMSAGAGGSAASGGVPASSGTPKGSSGGCAFTRPVGPSSELAAWLTIGALALLNVRRRR